MNLFRTGISGYYLFPKFKELEKASVFSNEKVLEVLDNILEEFGLKGLRALQNLCLTGYNVEL